MKNNKEETKSERKYYIDILRIIAAFSVVLLHMTATCNTYGTLTSNAHVIYNNLTRFAVTLFFMLSGAVFLSKKDLTIKKIYKVYVLRLLIILAIWLPVYRVFYYYLYGAHLSDFHNFLVIMKQIVSNQYHFWFLFPLIGIYICIPFLKKIADDETLLKYFIILFLVLVVGYNTLKLSEKFEDIYIYIPLFIPDFIYGYTGYFLIGYYLDKHEFDKRKTAIIYALGILSFIALGGGSLYMSYRNKVLFTKLCNNYIITSLLSASFMFLLFKNIFKNKVLGEKWKKVISFVSSNTLGVYIFHNFFRFTIEKASWYTKVNGPVGILICTLVIFIICLFISAIIKKIPFIGDKIV